MLINNFGNVISSPACPRMLSAAKHAAYRTDLCYKIVLGISDNVHFDDYFALTKLLYTSDQSYM
jgi:hypothetical protein